MEQPPAYYLALIVSAISTFGWLGGTAAFVYWIYLLVTGQPRTLAAWAIVIGIVVGAAFALLERRIYVLDQ